MRVESECGGSADVRAALLRLRRTSGLPVAFGGLRDGTGRYRISELTGAGTAALHGLAVRHGNGLGGKAAELTRPFAVTDYHASAVISHEYDAAVAAEGLCSVLAVPVVVRRRVRGVLYGTLRHPVQLGDRPLSAAMEAARELEQALLLQDEAQRLLSVVRQPAAADPAAWEEVREAHGDLRGWPSASPTRCCGTSCWRRADGWRRRPLPGAAVRATGTAGRRAGTAGRTARCWRRARWTSWRAWPPARPTR